MAACFVVLAGSGGMKMSCSPSACTHQQNDWHLVLHERAVHRNCNGLPARQRSLCLSCASTLQQKSCSLCVYCQQPKGALICSHCGPGAARTSNLSTSVQSLAALGNAALAQAAQSCGAAQACYRQAGGAEWLCLGRPRPSRGSSDTLYGRARTIEARGSAKLPGSRGQRSSLAQVCSCTCLSTG